MSMPNELINLIFSFKEKNPVNQIMKDTIKEWKIGSEKFTGRRARFQKYYFSISERVKKLRLHHKDRDRQWGGRDDVSIYEIKKYYNDLVPTNKRYGTREQIKKRITDFNKLVPSQEYRERMRLQKITYKTSK